MEKKCKMRLILGVSFLAAFVVWTILLCFVDVRAIGPRQSRVGFARVNEWFHALTGVNMWLYTITDWLGLVPIVAAFGFAVLGLVQWTKRKKLWKVDGNILALGVFYILVIAVYILFENIVVNYRPVLIEGYLEASYPSSTTMLVMCVMPTTVMQLSMRIKNKAFKRCVVVTIGLFIAFMVVGRVLSGVHWISDIVGGALFSVGLLLTYSFVVHLLSKKE